MKKVWSDSPDIIQERMDYLNQHNIPIILAQKGSESQTAYLTEIQQKKNFTTIGFNKTRNIPYKKEPCFFLYRPLEYLTHIFEGVPLLDCEENITIIRPPVIFELSKRKNPRVATTTSSRAVYLLPFSTRLCKAQLKDISLDGAFMVGPSFSRLEKGLQIGPVELTLECRSAAIDPAKVHIPVASVVRVTETEDGRAGIAINFRLEGDSLNRLHKYIEMRTMEVKGLDGGQR